MAAFGKQRGASKAYLSAFAMGDLRVLPHGRKVRIEASSTHPAQIQLLSKLFETRGNKIMYPIVTAKYFGWRIVYDLGQEFSYLLSSRERPYLALRNPSSSYEALSGLIDAEGHVGIGESKGQYHLRLTISNNDLRLIRLVSEGLRTRGFRPSTQVKVLFDSSRFYQISLNGRSALRLLKRIRLRHAEKIRARNLALGFYSDRHGARLAYLELRKEIVAERDRCVEEARRAYYLRGERKIRRRLNYLKLVEKAQRMRSSGESIARIGISLARPQRTVYRFLRLKLHGNEETSETK